MSAIFESQTDPPDKSNTYRFLVTVNANLPSTAAVQVRTCVDGAGFVRRIDRVDASLIHAIEEAAELDALRHFAAKLGDALSDFDRMEPTEVFKDVYVEMQARILELEDSS